MGWCHEFGCQITSGCNHPMRAGAAACTCAVCDTTCTGRFAGCPEVFARAVAVSGPSVRRMAATAEPPGSPTPRPAEAPPAVAPAPPAASAVPARQGSAFMSRENGTRILHWMRAEFDGIRSQLQAVASGLAHQQALYADMAGSRGGDLNAALAELEGSATQLRNEASRMRRDAGGLQEDGAELRRESTRIRELEREMTDRLPQMVAEAVQPELRATLREVEAITAGLREEAAQLRGIRDGLTEQLPRLVDAAVRRALADFTPPPPAPAPPPALTRAGSAPQANGFLEGAPGESMPFGTAGMGAGAPVTASPLADEPAEVPAPVAFGPPPAVDPAAADGGVGEDPLACTLPGIVVGPSLALAVSEALRRAALRRRRRRRPALPTPGLHRRDPFASQVTRRIDRYGRARTELASVKPGAAVAAGGTSGSNGASGPPPPSRVAVGFKDGEEVVVDLADHAVLALTGPAAADAARFLVTAFLAGSGDLDGQALVVGDLLPPGQSFPNLHQPAHLAAAVEQLAADGPSAPTILAVRDAAPADLEALAAQAGPRPLVVLVGEAPEGATTVRLSAGERVAEVGSDELAARLVGARLYTLAREAASELLGVLAGARVDEEVVPPSPGEAEAFEVVIPASPAVHVQLLGTYRIDVDGIEIRAGLRAKARELLAFYLLHPAGTTLDAAVEALWPEADPGRGSEWFWTALGNLRSRMRDATGDKKLKVIEREGDRYRVEPLFDVDLWRLEHALAEGAVAGDDFGRVAAYDRVAQAYAGELLAGADWAWAETPREDLRQRVLDVLVWLGDVRWSSGDARGSWQALQRAVEVDPYAEQIYRRIMRLQSKLGRPDDASVTFHRLRARLVEIDLEPTPESERLYDELSGGPRGIAATG